MKILSINNQIQNRDYQQQNHKKQDLNFGLIRSTKLGRDYAAALKVKLYSKEEVLKKKYGFVPLLKKVLNKPKFAKKSFDFTKYDLDFLKIAYKKSKQVEDGERKMLGIIETIVDKY